MRLTSVIMSLLVASCSTTWDAFRIANQDACTNHPLDCGSGKVCSYETRQCQPQNCRQSGFCWESPRPQLFSPRAIYGSSASDLWMLGTREIYRASGSTITPVITELPVRMNAIVGIAPDNILFLGEQGTILKWNGQRFEGDDSGVGASLLGGWASGSDNVWIVGEGGTLLHQSGGGWQQVDTQTSRTLSAVTGTADGVFAVGGSGSVLRWDGSSLTTESTTCATALLGIGQVGADLLSVGEGYCMTRRSGGVWTAVPSMSVPPTDKSGYFSVVGSYQGSSYVSGRPGTLYKLDGTSWSQLELTTMGVARSLLVLPTGDVWIGGSDLYRANGSLPVRLNARPQETLYALSGATADAMWATGFSGTVLRRNGTTWEPVRSDATSPLYGVYSPSADVAFVIGFDSSESTLSRCSSKACSIIEKASNLEYTSIHGIDADNYWVVGKSGVLKMWSAKSAALVDETGSLPKGASLNHVHAVAGAGGARPSVIAVGEQGLVMRRTAMGWLPDSSAPTGKQNLLAVWASADSDVFVGGSNGLIAHFDGSAWAVIPTSVTDTISGIAGTSASDVWAVTVQGSVLRYDGQQFKTVSRDELPSLQAISAVDGQVYIAGALGTILHKS